MSSACRMDPEILSEFLMENGALSVVIEDADRGTDQVCGLCVMNLEEQEGAFLTGWWSRKIPFSISPLVTGSPGTGLAVWQASMFPSSVVFCVKAYSL